MSDIWRCPACGQTITVLVPVTTPPTCTRHAGGGKAMKKEEKP